MLRRRLRMSFVNALAVGVLLSGVALAATVKVKVKNVEVPLPGVTAGGNLSFHPALVGDGLAKLTFNSRTGRLRVVARGKVVNLSGKKQKYEDVGILPNIGDVIKDDYKVARNGRAVYQGLSKNIQI